MPASNKQKITRSVSINKYKKKEIPSTNKSTTSAQCRTVDRLSKANPHLQQSGRVERGRLVKRVQLQLWRGRVVWGSRSGGSCIEKSRLLLLLLLMRPLCVLLLLVVMMVVRLLLLLTGVGQ